MRILHINTERTWRGGEQQTLYLLEGLQQREIGTHLVCQPESPLAERARAAGIEVFPIAMHGELDLPACRRMRKIIKMQHYDIIHSHTSHAHTLAFFASVGTGSLRLVTRRVDFSIFRHGILRFSALKYKYMADYYIAISQKIKNVLISDGIAPDCIFLVHSGIDPARFQGVGAEHLTAEFNLKDSEKIAINVAHLAGHKGQKYLVQAIPRVLAKFPETRFFIVGGGELLQELTQLADSLGLKDRLIFTGFREDVGAFYQLADLFVMSSIQEGLGTAVLDALAMKLPVVATRAGGLPEIITHGHNGLLVSPENPAALADGIIDMLTDSDGASQMAGQGPETIDGEFSITAMVNNNLKCYNRIISAVK